MPGMTRGGGDNDRNGRNMAMGISIGVALGVALGNIGAGMAIGAGIGAAIGISLSNRGGAPDPLTPTLRLVQNGPRGEEGEPRG